MNDYSYWENALANPAALHAREFRITAEPEPGFYRTRRMNEPVAIWRDEETGDTVVTVNGSEVANDDYENVWLSCARYPVPEKAYHWAIEHGEWADLDEVVAGIGDNRRRGDDPESMIDDLSAQAESYREVEDDDTARRAISLRAALLEQHKRADSAREEAKKPHLKAAREVDELWMPMVKKARKAADYLRAIVESWETKKRRLQREEEERRRAAEALQIPVTPVMTPEPVEQIRTGYGRAASVRTKLVVTAIHAETLFKWLNQHDTEALHVELYRLAQKAVDKGITPEGVNLEEQARVV